MDSTLEELKEMYLKRIEEINELERSKEELAKGICHKTYPFEYGQKIRFKTSESFDFIPAFFAGAYVSIWDYVNDNNEICHGVYAFPKFRRIKKDGTMSKRDEYIPIFDVHDGTLIIKPFEE